MFSLKPAIYIDECKLYSMEIFLLFPFSYTALLLRYMYVCLSTTESSNGLISLSSSFL